MPITLSNTTITGLAAGGLPSATVTSDTLSSAAVTAAKMGYTGAVLSVSYTTQTSFLNTTGGSIEIMSTTLTTVTTNPNILILVKTGGWSGDDSEIWLEWNLNSGGWNRDNKLNGVGDRKCIGDMSWSHLSNGGAMNVLASQVANFGSSVSTIGIRVMGQPENSNGGGLYINTGGGGGYGGFNYDSCQSNLTIMELRA